MDFVSEGIEAAPMGLEEFRAADRDARLAAAAGLVIMYDWWLGPEDFEVLDEIKKTRPVVFARNGQRKRARDPMRFSEVYIFDDTTFSHYQPLEGWGGYVELIEHFDRPNPPTDQRRRGFAFVSYVTSNRETVYGNVIPALAACRTGYFDYRYTARLNEEQLEGELARTIESCHVVVAYASSDWRTMTNANIRMERELAQRFGRPIVAVMTPADAAAIDPSMVRCVFGPDRDENARGLQHAMHQALGNAINLDSR
jgi:hypothetical protein